MSITGILLTGGKSKRMGMDKGLCKVNGKPLYRYALELLEKSCDTILLSANSDHYGNLGYPLVRDVVTDAGPLGGIYSCLLESTTTHNFVLSCDMPLVPAQLVEYILLHRKGFQAIVPTFNGFKEPLCACYSTDAKDHFRQCLEAGIFKMQRAIAGLNTLFLPIEPSQPFYRPDIFANANDPAALKHIGSLLLNDLENE